MNTPKVGETWISNSGIEHKIVYVSEKFIISKMLPTGTEYCFHNIRNIDYKCLSSKSNIFLMFKKKKRVTLYVGWKKGELGYHSYTYDSPIINTGIYAHVQTIEFDVEE